MKNIDFAAAFDTKNLDQNNPGSWPIGIKGIVVIGILAGIIAAGIYYGLGFTEALTERDAQLKKIEKKLEKELKPKFKQKAALAVNLEAYKAQLEQLKRSSEEMLQKLPEELHIDSLIIDISQTGLRSGLEFNLIKPGSESTRELYVEYPISISVAGLYHELGAFVSGLSELNRIVSVHNVDIKHAGGKGSELLQMSMTAKTYRGKKEEE
ncbi:MAG: pilus assembly protein PilO [Gammaproteobacteria bacterium]|nr:MAG: pilus assembly protein PilO [Gammaproteobacteria bacterium]